MRLTVNQYRQLVEYINLFKTRDIQMLGIHSLPGQGKSTIIKQVLPEAIVLSGKITPARMYDLLWEHKDELIIFDDIDDIHRDRQMIALVKCLCQTEPIKTLTWETRTRNMQRVSPDQFETSSRIVFLVNAWKTINDHVSAIEDRGILIDFQPSSIALHQHIEQCNLVGQSIHPDVYAFVGNYLPLFLRPSIRVYLTLTHMLLSGLDWQSVFFEHIGLDKEIGLVFNLMNSTLQRKDRLAQFKALTGKTERTFDRIQKRIKEMTNNHNDNENGD